jgi:hypothetical protein
MFPEITHVKNDSIKNVIISTGILISIALITYFLHTFPTVLLSFVLINVESNENSNFNIGYY